MDLILVYSPYAETVFHPTRIIHHQHRSQAPQSARSGRCRGSVGLGRTRAPNGGDLRQQDGPPELSAADPAAGVIAGHLVSAQRCRIGPNFVSRSFVPQILQP